jgi:RecG-like helicase
MALFGRRGRIEADTAERVELIGVIPIADAVARRRVRVLGEVARMRARPTTGMPSLAVTIRDSTGSVTAVWTGRRSIGGITLGRRVIIDGVATAVGDRLEFTNPAYTLLD